MSVEQGMNRPVVIEVSGQLKQDHSTLVDIQQNANQAVNKLAENWFGNDAQQFHAQWQQSSRTLDTAAQMIQQLSQTAETQAQAQESTSQG